MNNEMPFEGYKELIQIPLQQDQGSLDLIKQIFIQLHSSQPNPLECFTKAYRQSIFQSGGNNPLASYFRKQERYGAEVGPHGRIRSLPWIILQQNASQEVLFQTLEKPVETPVSNQKKNGSRESTRLISSGKLKEEILRSKRYKHALSAILLDIDEFRRINDLLS